MSDADVKMPPLPEPAAWRWPVRKLRGVEWRYTLYETRRNAVPLYTADQLRAAVLADRERVAAWLDQDWPADAHEERAHRAYIAKKLRDGS